MGCGRSGVRGVVYIGYYAEPCKTAPRSPNDQSRTWAPIWERIMS